MDGYSGLQHPSIMVCDHQPVFATGLATLLRAEPARFDVLAVTRSPSELEVLMREKSPDVVLLDAVFGTQAISQIRKACPSASVILLGSSEVQVDLPDALAAGAQAYLLKHGDVGEICDVMRVVLRGYGVAPADLLGQALRLAANPQQLSETERQILSMLAHGATNQEIAHGCHLSERTVRRHLIRIYSKLCVPDRIQAALYAVRSGLVTVDAFPDGLGAGTGHSAELERFVPPRV
jgi:two-component system, NarL family, response regulator LiaR